jgi:hypothetical protein
MRNVYKQLAEIFEKKKQQHKNIEIDERIILKLI